MTKTAQRPRSTEWASDLSKRFENWAADVSDMLPDQVISRYRKDLKALCDATIAKEKPRHFPTSLVSWFNTLDVAEFWEIFEIISSNIPSLIDLPHRQDNREPVDTIVGAEVVLKSVRRRAKENVGDMSRYSGKALDMKLSPELASAAKNTAYVPPSRAAKKGYTVYLSEEVAQELKATAHARQTTITQLFEEAIGALLEKERPRTAAIRSALEHLDQP